MSEFPGPGQNPPSPDDPLEQHYYLHDGVGVIGPIKGLKLKEMIECGAVGRGSNLNLVGAPNWTPIMEFAPFPGFFKSGDAGPDYGAPRPASAPGPGNFASFWIRLGAHLIDNVLTLLLLTVVALIFAIVIVAIYGEGAEDWARAIRTSSASSNSSHHRLLRLFFRRPLAGDARQANLRDLRDPNQWRAARRGLRGAALFSLFSVGPAAGPGLSDAFLDQGTQSLARHRLRNPRRLRQAVTEPPELAKARIIALIWPHDRGPRLHPSSPHTAFSLREGALTLGQLIQLAEKDAQPALAVTDTNNLFAALEFSEKAEKAGMQAIPGVQLAVDFGDAIAIQGRRARAREAGCGNLVLLAKTETGYRNLMRLCSRAYLGAEPGEFALRHAGGSRQRRRRSHRLDGRPRRRARHFARRSRASTRRWRGSRRWSRFSATGSISNCSATASRRSARSRRNCWISPIGAGLPLVATNEPFFASAEDFEAHDALLCVAEGTVTSAAERRRLTPTHYFRTSGGDGRACSPICPRRRKTASRSRGAAPSVRARARRSCRASSARRRRASALTLDEIEAVELRRQAEEGLEARLEATGPAPGLTREDYVARLDFELERHREDALSPAIF